MADDKLVLTAELVDKYSGALRDMTKATNQFKDLLKGAHTEGSKAAIEQAKRQKELTEQFVETGRKIREIVTPSFAAMGIGIVGAGEAMAAVIEKLKAAGENFYKVQGALSRTGLSLPQLETYSRALSKITGQSLDASRDQMSNLGEVAAKLSRSYSPMIAALESQFNNLNPLIKKMAQDGGAQAIDDFIEYYESHPAPPDQQRKLLSAMGLNPDLANATTEQLRKAIEESAEWVGKHPPINQQLAEQLHKVFEDLNDSVDGFQSKIVTAFGPETIAVVKFFANFIEHLGEDIKKSLELPSFFWTDPGSVPDYVRRFLSIEPKQPNRDHKMHSAPSEPIPYRGLKRKTFGPVYDPTAFIEGGGGSDIENIMSRSVKSGMLEAFREWFASVQSPSGGFQNASFGPAGAAARGFGGAGYGVMPGGGHQLLARALGMDTGTPGVGPGRGTVGPGGDPRGLAGFIRDTAARYGVDPDTAIAVAKSEGLGGYIGDGGTSFGAYQLHMGGGLGDEFMRDTGLDPRDPRNERAMIVWTLKNAHRTGWGPYHGARNSGIGPRAGLGGMVNGTTGSQLGRSNPYSHIGGLLSMDGKKYRWGSGGGGFASMPFGDYPITPGTIGSWGQAHGALGINNNAMFDPLLHRMRQGIELHSGSSDALITEGCMAIAGAQWPELKARVLAMIRDKGSAYLHLGADGASITPYKPGQRNLLSNGAAAGMTSGRHTVEGNASVNVAFQNAPAGAKAYMKYGGMFKSGSVDWGHPMSPSNSGGEP